MFTNGQATLRKNIDRFLIELKCILMFLVLFVHSSGDTQQSRKFNLRAVMVREFTSEVSAWLNRLGDEFLEFHLSRHLIFSTYGNVKPSGVLVFLVNPSRRSITTIGESLTQIFR